MNNLNNNYNALNNNKINTLPNFNYMNNMNNNNLNLNTVINNNNILALLNKISAQKNKEEFYSHLL